MTFLEVFHEASLLLYPSCFIMQKDNLSRLSSQDKEGEDPLQRN